MAILKARDNNTGRFGLAHAIVLVMLLVCAAFWPADKAYAGETYLEIGPSEPYAGYETNWMWAEGDRIAYCAEPSKPTPPEGYYTKEDVELAPASTYSVEQLRSALWYGYGGPGFDPSMWPSTWYNGAAMDDGCYLALTHIIIADIYACDGGAALYGCNAEFKQWVYNNIIGVNIDDPGAVDPNAIERRMVGELVATVPARFEIFMLNSDGYSQTISYSGAYTPAGRIKLVKSSATPAVSDDNDCYDLEGAVYGVFTTRADAESRTNPWFTQSTGQDNPDGSCASDLWITAWDIPPATYYIREIESPEGFLRDDTIFEAVVIDNDTAEIAATDVPLHDPIAVMLAKEDAATGSIPQGCASLEGAQFEVRYFDGYYSERELPRTATGAWTMRTDADGKMLLDTAHLVEGDVLYYADGIATLPLGTIALRETKAPEGYLMPTQPQTYVFQIVEHDGEAAIRPMNYSGTVTIENTPIVPNDVIRGGVSVQKTDALTHSAGASSGLSLAGARFEIINANGQAITIGEKTYSDEAVVATMTTDASGFAKTEDDALPYGTYTVREAQAPTGYALNTGWSSTVEITSAGTIVSAGTCENEPLRGAISIVKLDRDTHTAAPQGDATLAGTTFEIIDSAGNVVATIETDDDGYAATDMELLVGAYTVRETASSTGYAYDNVSKRWSAQVNVVAGETYALSGAESPTNRVLKGRIALSKNDAAHATAQGDATLEGAVFHVINRSDHAVLSPDSNTLVAPGSVVTILTTDADGAATSDDLSYGTYEIVEASAPRGYVLDTSWSETVLIRAETTTAVAVSDDVMRGGVIVGKRDADTSQPEPQGDAALEGAEFTVYNRSAHEVLVAGRAVSPGDAVCTLLAGDDGTAATDSDALPYGTYEVRETKAPEGYALNEGWSVVFSVQEDGQIVELDSEGDAVRDRVVRGGLSVSKADRETGKPSSQGDATLEGTEFTVYNRSAMSVIVSGTEYAPGDAVATIVAESSGVAATASDALPYGTYEVRETKAPEGYALNEGWSAVVEVREQGEQLAVSMDDPVKRGGVIVGKRDRESNELEPLGAATLAGACFEIINCSASDVLVEGTAYTPGSIVATIETALDEQGYAVARTANNALPYGTYKVRETASSHGYLFDSDSQNWSHTFSIREDGMLVDLTSAETAASNQVIRGDLAFSKVDAKTNARLALIPFLVTSKTTGEAHVIVTDENGMVSTANSWNNHANATNNNDAALREDNTVDDDMLDPLAGIWFGGTTPRADHGALPFDTYTVQELRCNANEGYALASFDIVVARDGRELYLGTVDDHTLGSIRTSLTDKQGASLAPCNSSTVLVDTVAYTDMEPGTYTLFGELHVVDEDGVDHGVVARAETTTEIVRADGQCEVEFAIDTTPLRGCTLVAFERMVDIHGMVVAEHADLTDEAQSIRVPTIETTLAYDELDHAAPSSERVELADTIAYKGLVAGQTYTVTGTLHIRNDDGSDGGTVLDEAGNALIASTTFEAQEASGIAEVTFEFDAKPYAGKTLVAFESLEYQDVRYAVHANLSDENQTVYLPRIETTATSMETDTHVAPALGQTAIEDVVAYSNLIPGTAYHVIGELHARSAEGIEKGIIAEAEEEFTPDEPSGTITLSFEVDGEALAGASVVAFETLTCDDVVLAVHADIDDAGQTVSFPAIETTATDNQSATHVGSSVGATTITDIVTFSGLETGRMYAVSGVLHRKLDDGSDDGIVAEAQTEFVPDASSGTVALSFEVDGEALAGTSVVAFETLVYEGVELAVHADIDDEDQTVRFPSLHTTATSKVTGTHEAPAAGLTTLVDCVTYENLEPGTTYVLEGELHARQAQGSDENIVATARCAFVPDTPDGSVDVSFEFDGTNLAGTTLVVFESLFLDEFKLAVHADINDEGQSIHIPRIETTATSLETDAHVAPSTGLTTIVDEVAYENLIPGHAYEMIGSLHLKNADGTDGGSIAEAQAAFAPDEPDGIVVLSFDVDGEALAGAAVVAFEALTCNDVVLAEHENIDDIGQTVFFPAIETTATADQSDMHAAPSTGKVTITDVVSYSGLEPEKRYTMVGTLHTKYNGSDGGIIAEAQTEFVPDAPSSTVALSFEVDGEALAGSSAVAFETLVCDGVELAVHADIDDEDQTVHFPSLHTTATSKTTSTHEAPATGATTIIDAVAYQNLIPGCTYMLDGSLHLRSAAGEDEGAIAHTQIKFAPHETEGTIEVEFEVDGAMLANTTVVAFETLTCDDVVMAAHTDIDDYAQTISFPHIQTTLVDAESASHTASCTSTCLVDTVAYENLEPGQRYTVQGILHARSTTGTDLGAITDEYGNAVVAETSFEAVASSGTVEVVFEFDARYTPSREVVAFETLLRKGVELAVHADISDENQTVRIPGITTSATDAASGHKSVVAGSKLAIQDSISYEGLTAGQTYKITGELHERDSQGNDMGAVTKAEALFCAEAAEGTAAITFEMKFGELTSDRTFVAFERLFDEQGTLIGVHEDITSEDQAVVYKARPHIPSTGDRTTSIVYFATCASALATALLTCMHVRRRARVPR